MTLFIDQPEGRLITGPARFNYLPTFCKRNASLLQDPPVRPLALSGSIDPQAPRTSNLRVCILLVELSTAQRKPTRRCNLNVTKEDSQILVEIGRVTGPYLDPPLERMRVS